jgi:hypothetical protein
MGILLRFTLNNILVMAKYKQVKIIQQNFGSWEDVSEYDKDDRVNLLHDLKEYRMMGYPTRVITRRVLNV